MPSQPALFHHPHLTHIEPLWYYRNGPAKFTVKRITFGSQTREPNKSQSQKLLITNCWHPFDIWPLNGQDSNYNIASFNKRNHFEILIKLTYLGDCMGKKTLTWLVIANKQFIFQVFCAYDINKGSPYTLNITDKQHIFHFWCKLHLFACK